MTQSLDRHKRAVCTRRVATRMLSGIRHAILSLTACAAIFLAGGVAVISIPAAAQSAKEKDALAKEVRGKRAEEACKVIGAGFLLAPDNGYVEISCPGKEPFTAFSPAKGGGQEILSVALAAISTGKPVHVAVNPGFPTIRYLILVNR
jgi:hypothetical protein